MYTNQILQVSDYSNWTFLVQFGIVALMLFIGNVIRNRVGLFNKLMFPTAIIAGFIGLGFKYLVWGLNITIEGNPVLTNSFLQSITYHAIALGFIAMGLKTVRKTGSKEIVGKPIKSGLVIVSTYLLQAIVGISVTLLFSFFFTDMVRHAGLLLPFGFGQGPGQAGNIGTTFEGLGFVGGNTFGLSVATIGVLWSCILGIFYINKYAKDKKSSNNGNEISEVTKEVVEHADEIPISEAIDKMSIQIIFVILIYFISYLFMKLLTSLIPIESISGLIWGFNFIFGMLFALLFKNLSRWLRTKKVVVRRYTNNYMLNRITGVVFDFLIISSIMAIDIKTLANTQLLVTLLVMSSIGIIVTYIYLRFVIKRVYSNYEHEAFAVFFGNLTGTASNGIALLREIDPSFKTPASDDLVTGSSTAVLFGAPILIITGTISSANNWVFWLSFLALATFFILFSFLLLKRPKMQT